MCRFLRIDLGTLGVLVMKETSNRRRAPRLRCRVTVRYADNTKENKTTCESQMLDVSSGGLAFRCHADENCPHEGQQLVMQFSIPNSEVHDSSMMEFNRTGRVLRVQEVNSTLRNVAVRFDEPLPVGKVFFDNIGLYLSSPKSQIPPIDDHADADEGPFPEMMLRQQFKTLEYELAELKRLVLRYAEPDDAE